MIFFFTWSRANREFDHLLAKLESFEPRIQEWREEIASYRDLGMPNDGPEELIRELQRGQLAISTDLRKARLGIRMGAHRWREAVPLLRASKVGVGFIEAHLNQLDATQSAARAGVGRLLR